MSQVETHRFQTEVEQLLHLVIHSLYSNRDIFLRELISNASDALDKLRFEALSNDALYEGDGELAIRVSYDRDAGTITVEDNGIGMSRDDVVENIGTIASSGTRRFLAQLSGDQKKDSALIGQFGVGFYSAFIVADRVTLETRRAGADRSEGVRWVSEGKGEYTLEAIEKEKHGTRVILHLKDDAKEYLDGHRLRSIIREYSDHISFPIYMPKEEFKDGETVILDEWEQVNKATALWLEPRSKLKDEDYINFYKQTFHDFEDPLTWLHNRVEGTLEYTSLFYIPKVPPFDLYDRERRYGVKLYVKRVFIMDDAEHLLPAYLRFVRGIIDSDDLPLNVSREILQDNQVVRKIRSASTRRILDHLDKLSREDADRYATFWDAFGNVLKEGVVEDHGNREKIAKLLRFASTHEDSEKQRVSLDDYISRMKDDQKAIYYIVADSYAAAKNSPHLELFRKKGIEVLLMYDRIDEWLVGHLHEYDGKPLKSVTQADLDIEDDAEVSKEEKKAADKLAKRLKKALGDAVEDVRTTTRLTDSPARVVPPENGLSPHMIQMLRQMGQEPPKQKLILEINPTHALIRKLERLDDDQKLKDWGMMLLEQAQLADGMQLEDPGSFVRRLNTLLSELV
ncbi:molecular chaperone HtpG [Sulfurivirga sp.]|uniref:molecular chaperone HtpG n=1 Tax=Sulfurivirga sp. TaxID=2614236 RepID=UPI0025F4927B|nr:molecular chaperone HtpG [Sulfurivirga sp.]